jgi:hypothetical protein
MGLLLKVSCAVLLPSLLLLLLLLRCFTASGGTMFRR